ncbi:MAG: SRPBCC family protein [Cyclobacteriaceae bacterium]
MFTLECQQQLPLTLKESWDFFSSPKNLEKMTPSHMNFCITSGEPGKMYAGQIISYTVNILPGLKSNWVTEISHVDDKKMFVDEQRFGPYSMWHHEHIFEETNYGTLMTDKVSYKIPFGILGILVESLFIRAQLRKIFEYRQETLNRLF